jgi:Zn-dependent protease
LSTIEHYRKLNIQIFRIFGNVRGRLSEVDQRTTARLSDGACMGRFLVPFRMHSTGWLLLAMCVLFGVMLRGWLLGPVIGGLLVLSLLLHEVGHMLAATLLGVPVREFGLCLAGAYNRRAFAQNRRDEVLISSAGPLMNLLAALPFLFVPHIGIQLAICNLTLCVVNLLPLPSSDGLRILRTIAHPNVGDSTIRERKTHESMQSCGVA